MKSINNVKNFITRLNNLCVQNNTTIFTCLNALNMSFEEFCDILGIDASLLYSNTTEVLLSLLKDPSTKISYNHGMTSLEQTEISIYSKTSNINFGYLKDKIKITWDRSYTKDGKEYYQMEFLATQKEEESLKTIHFSSDVIFNLKEANDHNLSLNFPLKHVNLKINYITSSLNHEPINNQDFQITINQDMLYSDLQNIYRMLYNFNYPLALSVLKLYPSSMKIIGTSSEMNNFLNR